MRGQGPTSRGLGRLRRPLRAPAHNLFQSDVGIILPPAPSHPGHLMAGPLALRPHKLRTRIIRGDSLLLCVARLEAIPASSCSARDGSTEPPAPGMHG